MLINALWPRKDDEARKKDIAPWIQYIPFEFITLYFIICLGLLSRLGFGNHYITIA